MDHRPFSMVQASSSPILPRRIALVPRYGWKFWGEALCKPTPGLPPGEPVGPQADNVRYWHLADIDAGAEHVCFGG